ncbi:methyltransferase FkbM family [Thalassoporum mexicanum PCC 7367]|uniref:FkbM family methyltransferase n=1 Tax=Thalassoporum mexicanum TaxID=3457544 RepID=UPI00029FB4B8|nr:FkbM family methyltransferase [Pseudanabaena sp. PCC 7367]AFY71573.1 methyltransferase FkbM family [Pseudanabaena sp. PCC 7367]
MQSSSPAQTYIDYLHRVCPLLNPETIAKAEQIASQTDWDEPVTGLELNNCAVVALIEAEQCEQVGDRQFFIEMALTALNEGIALDGYPLCSIHLSLLHTSLGVGRNATNNFAMYTLLNQLQDIYNPGLELPPALVYLPIDRPGSVAASQIKTALQVETGHDQALIMFAEAIWRSPLVFYSPYGLRLLRLAQQLTPAAAHLNLQLGISSMVNNQLEGLYALHRAQALAPDFAAAIQTLYLAYLGMQQLDKAKYWLAKGQQFYQANPKARQWQWASLPIDSTYTYAAIASDLVMAIEPSFKSIVTMVLLAQGRWFEQEMEFWQEWLKPGMVVIDVGANAGIYTFVAAQQVGASGKVLAVEPFADCIAYMQETCRLNQLEWVTVCAGAASDRNGTIKFMTQNASELNMVITEEQSNLEGGGNYDQVDCFTLDHLVEQEGLTRVDFLKVDAEGHEMQVFQGSDRLLKEFAPIILYENIAGASGANLPVANYLRAQGYQLFYYQPFAMQLIPLGDRTDLAEFLNVIALPAKMIA